MTAGQLTLDFLYEGIGINSISLNDAVENLANRDSSESRGAVFTRLEVVEFILNLAGYTENQPLYEKRLLEPSFGGGQFLLPIIKRLLAAWRRSKSETTSKTTSKTTSEPSVAVFKLYGCTEEERSVLSGNGE